MTTALSPIRIRLKLVYRVMTDVLCTISNATPVIWRGSPVNIECGFFYDAATIFDDFSNINRVFLAISRDITTVPIVQKILAAVDVDVITKANWETGASAQNNALFTLTSLDTQLPFTTGVSVNGQQQFRLVVFAETKDAEPQYYTLGKTTITVVEDGAANDLSVHTPQENFAFRIADGELQLWNQTQSKWHTIYIDGAAGAEHLSIGGGES